jgi:hypothetical protein
LAFWVVFVGGMRRSGGLGWLVFGFVAVVCAVLGRAAKKSWRE